MLWEAPRKRARASALRLRAFRCHAALRGCVLTSRENWALERTRRAHFALWLASGREAGAGRQGRATPALGIRLGGLITRWVNL
eukprot:6310465-Alexandrium_andersonii.AAC.1